MKEQSDIKSEAREQRGNKFQCIKNQSKQWAIQLTLSHDKHVPEVERYMRTRKERMQATTNTLPFEQLPHQLIVEIAYFPNKNGKTLSPQKIVTGSKIAFKKHYKQQCGTYSQMHVQHNNSLFPRTAGL